MVCCCLLLTPHLGSRCNFFLSSSHPVCNFIHSYLRNKIIECLGTDVTFFGDHPVQHLQLSRLLRALAWNKIKGNLAYKSTGIILYSPPLPPSLLGEDAENKSWWILWGLPIFQPLLILYFPVSLQQQGRATVTRAGKELLHRIQFPLVSLGFFGEWINKLSFIKLNC